MKRFAPAVFTVVALVSGAAFAQGQAGQMGQKGQPSAAQAKQTGIQLPKEEQKFVQMMHGANQKEIRLGQLAEQKAQNQQVRDFGKMMVQDHQQADQQLQQMAQKQKWKMQMPRPQDARERADKQYDDALEAKLKVLEGAAFDQAYMAAMVADHDETVAKAVMAQQQYTTPELTQMLGQMTPKLVQHREQAYRVLGQIGSHQQLGVGGSGMGPGGGSGPMMDGQGPHGAGNRAPMRGGGSGGPGSTNREGTLSPGGPGSGTTPDARGGSR